MSDYARTTTLAYVIAYERDPYGKGTIVRKGRMQGSTVDRVLFCLNEELKVDVGNVISESLLVVSQ
jgi:hypothetical protein